MDGRVPADDVQLPASSGGKSLSETVRQQMERALGASFADVRIHEGPEAASIGAIAYTRGSHIHFQPGQYNPASRAGQELLGHELAHVVQQRAGQVATPHGKGVPINNDLHLETEADTAGKRITCGETVRTIHPMLAPAVAPYPPMLALWCSPC